MLAIVRAIPADIPSLMRIERREGYEHLVGRWTAEQHAAEMEVPGSLYLVDRPEPGAEARGFAMLQHLDSSDLGATLRRIAVADPGEGRGAALLTATLAHVFGETSVHRLQLYVYPENERAHRAYRRAGFVEDGLVRDFRRMPDGRFRSMRLMSILRPDWLVSRRT